MPVTNTSTRWLTLWLSLLCATEIHAQNPLQRCGQGQFRFLGWSIYQAELFSANCPVQANQTFTLSIHYFIPISQAHLIATTDQELNRMHGHWPQQTLKKWNLEMEQAFRSVHSGDTFTGYYQPGLGARFYLNNIPTAEIPDTEFANWIFQIWLGPNAHDRHLRETLNPGGNWRLFIINGGHAVFIKLVVAKNRLNGGNTDVPNRFYPWDTRFGSSACGT